MVKSKENEIIFNNDDYIVINKSSGVAVQGGTKSFKNLIDKIKYVIENYNIAINRSKNAKKNLSKFLVSNSKFYLNLIYKNLNENYK